MADQYIVADEVPPLDDYLRLRLLAGLSPKSREGAEVGLPNSVFGVTIRENATAVGMGRIIGDHGLFFQVTDIAVDPAHQGARAWEEDNGETDGKAQRGRTRRFLCEPNR